MSVYELHSDVALAFISGTLRGVHSAFSHRISFDSGAMLDGDSLPSQPQRQAQGGSHS